MALCSLRYRCGIQKDIEHDGKYQFFLGLKGPVVKSHGGTDSIGFYYSIDLCYKIVKGNLMSQIRKNLKHSKSVWQ